MLDHCVSGRAREVDNAVDGTGYAGVRGRARSHNGRMRFSFAVRPWR